MDRRESSFIRLIWPAWQACSMIATTSQLLHHRTKRATTIGSDSNHSNHNNIHHSMRHQHA
eukprot:12104295-Karenia_brevis.AAC.1